jgi:hypothetical protein
MMGCILHQKKELKSGSQLNNILKKIPSESLGFFCFLAFEKKNRTPNFSPRVPHAAFFL